MSHTPGAVGEHQHATAVEEAVLKLSSEAGSIAEGQLTQAMTQTCRHQHRKVNTPLSGTTTQMFFFTSTQHS